MEILFNVEQLKLFVLDNMYFMLNNGGIKETKISIAFHNEGLPSKYLSLIPNLLGRFVLSMLGLSLMHH